MPAPQPAMDRRAFLRRAGVVAGGVGATALVGSLAACSGGSGHSQAGGTTTTSTSGKSGGPPKWSELAGMLSGTLVVPGNATYANDALLFNELITSPQPAAIAYCASAADVQRCVAYARAHDVPLAARSGGHSYAGYSSSAGLVIDVSSLNTVSVASGMQLATVGAGAQLVDVYSQLGSSGRLLPGGSCPTVGIAGLALGEESACSGGPTA